MRDKKLKISILLVIVLTIMALNLSACSKEVEDINIASGNRDFGEVIQEQLDKSKKAEEKQEVETEKEEYKKGEQIIIAYAIYESSFEPVDYDEGHMFDVKTGDTIELRGVNGPYEEGITGHKDGFMDVSYDADMFEDLGDIDGMRRFKVTNGDMEGNITMHTFYGEELSYYFNLEHYELTERQMQELIKAQAETEKKNDSGNKTILIEYNIEDGWLVPVKYKGSHTFEVKVGDRIELRGLNGPYEVDKNNEAVDVSYFIQGTITEKSRENDISIFEVTDPRDSTMDHAWIHIFSGLDDEYYEFIFSESDLTKPTNDYKEVHITRLQGNNSSYDGEYVEIKGAYLETVKTHTKGLFFVKTTTYESNNLNIPVRNTIDALYSNSLIINGDGKLERGRYYNIKGKVKKYDNVFKRYIELHEITPSE